MTRCLLQSADGVHQSVPDAVEPGEEAVAELDPEGEMTGEGVGLHDPREALAVTLHLREGTRALVDDEAEDTSSHHALRLEMPADHRPIVVLDGFREVHGREVHERLPRDDGGASRKEEGEGFSVELPLRSCLLVQRKGPHAVDDVLEVGGDREVPNRRRKHNPMCLQYLLLEGAEVIIGDAGCRVALEGEVLDVEIPQTHGVHGDPPNAPYPFYESLSQGCAIARIVRAGYKTKNTRFHDEECTDAVGDVSW